RNSASTNSSLIGFGFACDDQVASIVHPPGTGSEYPRTSRLTPHWVDSAFFVHLVWSASSTVPLRGSAASGSSREVVPYCTLQVWPFSSGSCCEYFSASARGSARARRT